MNDQQHGAAKGARTIRRILFVHPPGNRVKRPNGERGLKACVQPVGLAGMAAYARERGYAVEICDAIAEGYDEPETQVEPHVYRYGLTNMALARRIDDCRPDLVAISCPQVVRLPEAFEVAAVAHGAAPGVPVVIGGAAASGLGARVLELCRDIDYAIVGEGEQRLLDLAAALTAGDALGKVDGLVWRDGGTLRVNPARQVIEDLDALPMPAYDLLPMETYFAANRNPSVHSSAQRTCTMITSRGCGLRCYYCPVHKVFGPTGPRYRLRSNEHVGAEIQYLIDRHGVEELQFEDANFNMSRKRTVSISNFLGERFPGLRWTTPHGNQVSTLTPDVMAAMHAGGCYSLHLAIESGNQAFLDERKDVVKLDAMDELLRRAGDVGFFRSTFFMIGFPEETRAAIRNTVRYAETLEVDDVHFFIATPFPGTEMYDLCERNGWLAADRSWRHFRYSWGVIETAEFDRDWLQQVRREAWIAMQARIGERRREPSLHDREAEVFG